MQENYLKSLQMIKVLNIKTNLINLLILFPMILNKKLLNLNYQKIILILISAILKIFLKKEKILKFLILRYITFSKIIILNLKNLIDVKRFIDVEKEKNVKEC